MALSCVVSEILNVEKYRDLDIRVVGHSRSLKVVSFDRLHMVSYYCSIVTLSLRRTVFEIINFKHAMTLKTRLGVHQGHWKCHHSIERMRLPLDVL